MAGRYVAPEYDVSPFTCPHEDCQTLATQFSSGAYMWVGSGTERPDESLRLTWCSSCERYTVWQSYEGLTPEHRRWRMAHLKAEPGTTVDAGPEPEQYKTAYRIVFPISSAAPEPNPDLPASVLADYEEAARVLPHSARAAAALLRLCVQKMCADLGHGDKTIDKAIGALVAEQKVSESLQQAMDTVRITGNESVHPGELDLRDDPELATMLFSLVNRIAHRAYTEPRENAELYSKMPESKRDGIAQRDQPSA